MTPEDRYPAIADLAEGARRRLPHFVWEYLDSATGGEQGRSRAEQALDAVTLTPRVLRGAAPVDLGRRIMGRDWARPFGIAPVGMSGLIWPGAEVALARSAARAGLPMTLSTVAAAAPETVGPHLEGRGWFQLYPPGDAAIRADLLARVAAAGFDTLVLTVDVPMASRRERQRRARLSHPMRLTPQILWQAARRPAWALATLRHGRPGFPTLEPYVQRVESLPGTAHVGYLLRTAPDMAYLHRLREEWQGRLVVKGVLDPQDARAALDAGADAIWVSAHGGRQFEGAPAPARQLPLIRAALGPGAKILCDTGVRSGLDILRMLALGADMVMLGRAFHYALGALGPGGADHCIHLLSESLRADLAQLGCATLDDLPDHLAPGPDAA